MIIGFKRACEGARQPSTALAGHLGNVAWSESTRKRRTTIKIVWSRSSSHIMPWSDVAGLVSIRTGSLVLLPSRSFVDHRIDRRLRREVGDEPVDKHAAGRRSGPIGPVLAKFSPSLVALDRELLDVVGLDLIEEPGTVIHRDLGPGHELPEDQRKPSDQEQPEPGGADDRAGQLAPGLSGAGSGVGFSGGGGFSMGSRSIEVGTQSWSGSCMPISIAGIRSS